MGDHHVDVSGAVRVAAHDLEELSRGSGGVNGVLGGLEAVEPELAVLVGAELATKVVAGLVLRVEDVVLAVGAGLPHVEDGTGNALAGVNVPDNTMEEGEFAVLGHVLDYAATEFAEGSFGGPERSENGGGGRSAAIFENEAVVDFIDETATRAGQRLIRGGGKQTKIIVKEKPMNCGAPVNCRCCNWRQWQ